MSVKPRKLPVIKNNENRSACQACARMFKCTCCQACPGTYHPDDLGGRIGLRAVLVRGLKNRTLEVNQRDGRMLYVRPRKVLGPIKNRCVQLGKEGCRLPFERRPLQCRALVPNAFGPCDGPKWARMPHDENWWKPYQRTIRAAVKEAKATKEQP